jgi:AraC family transcriptional regulator
LGNRSVDLGGLAGGRDSRHPEVPPRLILPGVQLVRRGKRTSRFLDATPRLSSVATRWRSIAIEEYSVPACIISHHEHPEIFLHVVLNGSVPYEVSTCGRTRRFAAIPGTTFILPRGTVDEVKWEGPTRRLAVAIEPELLAGTADDTMGGDSIELVEHWNLVDHNVSAVLQAMKTDLSEGSPVGRLYGESLASALAVYLVGRYAVRPPAPFLQRGGMPGRRLRRVLDYIGDNLAEDLSLAELAAVAGMSPHYFSELFSRSVGHPPHRYVLSQRIERAKECLRNPGNSVLEAGLSAGFENPSHFARAFRKLVGVTPRQFRAGT